MSNAQIYDLVVILILLLSTAFIFLASFKKLPLKAQGAFDTVNPFKPIILKIGGVILLINIIIKATELI